MDSGTVVTVLGKVVPMYVAILFGYISARRNVVSKAGYEGLHVFVVYMAIPFQTMGVIVQTNLYESNLSILVAVFLNAALCLAFCIALVSANHFLRRRKNTRSRFPIDSVATYFGIMSFPNVLIVGLPLLSAMYGPGAQFVLVLVVVVRNACINPLLVTLYEIHAAVTAKSKTAGSPSKTAISHPQHPHAGTMGSTSETATTHGDNKVDVKEGEASDNAIAQAPGEHDVDSIESQEDGAHRAFPTLPVEPVDPHATKEAFAPADAPGNEDETNEDACVESQSNGALKKHKPMITLHPIFKNIVKSLVKNPVMRAAFVGALYSLIAYGVDPAHKPPEFISGTMAIFSNCLSGLAFFNVGFSLYGNPVIPPRSLRLQLAGALLARFVAAPVSMGLAGYLAGLRGADWRVITLQAALPLAVLPYSLARHYDSHAAVMGLVITIGTILSMALVIGYYFILEVNPNFVA